MPRGRWVLATLFPFGWFTWLGFAYAGARAKRPAWLAAAAAYFLVIAAAIVVTSLDEDIDGIEDDVGYLTMFLVWGGGIAHALMVRKAYLRRMALLEDPALQAARQAQERQAYARELASREPELAREAEIGRSGGFDEGGVVDVNHAPVEDIADLPRISAATARQIVAAREQVGGFSSLEDLGMTMDLPGDVVEELRGRVVFLPR
jgi:DNA uptake protein ComE-like DNA-binding protein